MPQQTARILHATIVVLGLAWVLQFALAYALDIPTLHIDGAFQTANALYRLDAGELPGRDFYPYLGIGPMLLLLPLFELFGADLAASMIAAQIVTLLVSWCAAALVWHLLFRSNSLLASAAAGAALFLGPFILAGYIGVEFTASPGNSLRPVRALLPYLVIAVHHLGVMRIAAPRLRHLAAGLLTGLALLWVNDLAIPTAGLYAVLIGLQWSRDAERTRANAIAYATTAAAVWLVALTLVTGGHPLAQLHYNFVDVAHDQWWLYGQYSAAARVFGVGDLGRLVSHENAVPLLVLAVMWGVTIWRRQVELLLATWIGTVLFAGGVLVSLGGHLGGYFQAFQLWGMVTTVVGLACLARACMPPALRAIAVTARVGVVLLGGLVTLGAAANLDAWGDLRAARATAAADPARVYVPELGGYLGREWQDYLALARRTPDARVLEEYWGVWSALRRSQPDWPIDSVIHALGGVREVAAGKLAGAELVITTRYATMPEFQPWSVTQNYWLFGELVRGWSPQEVSPTTVVWRRSARRELAPVACRIDAARTALVVDADAAGFYEVEVDYALAAHGRRLLMLRNNMSFGTDAGGYASLDPAGSWARLPAYAPNAGPLTLDAKVVGASDDGLGLAACRAAKIPALSAEVFHAPD